MGIVWAHTHIYTEECYSLCIDWLLANFTQTRVTIWEEMLPIDCPAGNPVRHIVDWWLIWKVPGQCGWYGPLTGCHGIYKRASWEIMRSKKMFFHHLPLVFPLSSCPNFTLWCTIIYKLRQTPQVLFGHDPFHSNKDLSRTSHFSKCNLGSRF